MLLVSINISFTLLSLSLSSLVVSSDGIDPMSKENVFWEGCDPFVRTLRSHEGFASRPAVEWQRQRGRDPANHACGQWSPLYRLPFTPLTGFLRPPCRKLYLSTSLEIGVRQTNTLPRKKTHGTTSHQVRDKLRELQGRGSH